METIHAYMNMHRKLHFWVLWVSIIFQTRFQNVLILILQIICPENVVYLFQCTQEYFYPGWNTMNPNRVRSRTSLICVHSVKFTLQYSLPKYILMHLQMQRHVWLDNVINLRQYILRYTVANPTSLSNVAFHWLTSEYMQLASGFMQLAAAGRIGATKNVFTVLLQENVNSALKWE